MVSHTEGQNPDGIGRALLALHTPLVGLPWVWLALCCHEIWLCLLIACCELSDEHMVDDYCSLLWRFI